MPTLRTLALLVALALAGAGHAQSEAARDAESPRYIPPDVGAPKTRVAASSRDDAACATYVDVLAPRHTGLTRTPTPTVWWHLAADCGHPVEISVVEAASFAAPPLLQRRLPPPSPGFHPIELADLAAPLAADRAYRVNVALIVDPASRSADVFAAATLRRVERPELAATSAGGLARAGLWYDALDTVMRADGEAATTARGTLLRQVGLTRAAASLRPVHRSR
jgi:hypothetical protein